MGGKLGSGGLCEYDGERRFCRGEVGGCKEISGVKTAVYQKIDDLTFSDISTRLARILMYESLASQ